MIGEIKEYIKLTKYNPNRLEILYFKFMDTKSRKLCRELEKMEIFVFYSYYPT